jgi:hypothetical protein
VTFRLTIATGDAIVATDYPTRGDVHDAFAGAWQPGVTLAVVQELEAPEPTTWGTVQAGDEIIAPDNSCWRLESSSGDGQVYLVAIDDGRPLTFSVTDDMPIRRRPGVLTAAVQLLHDVGLCGGPA